MRRSSHQGTHVIALNDGPGDYPKPLWLEPEHLLLRSSMKGEKVLTLLLPANIESEIRPCLRLSPPMTEID